MHLKYKTIKYDLKKNLNIEDLVSIEEPLEMILKYKEKSRFQEETISITMRTPGHDEDLFIGLLFNEGIINSFSDIKNIQIIEEKNLKNKISIELDKSDNIKIKNLMRNFLTNSSCGVCGKTSIDAIDVILKKKLNLNVPQIDKTIITKIPKLLKQNQLEFSKTGGIHASALFIKTGKALVIREDVGRHNALDKVIGYSLKKNLFKTKEQFIACSGRLNFELVQKALMANIGVLIGVGAPTSLAIDLAKRFNMTLVGFVKSDRFNIYCGENRILLN